MLLLASMTLSATAAANSLALGEVSPWTSYGSIWFTVVLGNFVGMLLFAPQVILYTQGSLGRWRPAQLIETAAVFLAVLLVGLLVFCGFPAELRGYPLEFLCVPVLTWAAFRLGRREAALALLLLRSSPSTARSVATAPSCARRRRPR